MPSFSTKRCVSHGADDVDEFVEQHLCHAPKVLFIGTVGIEASSLYFANKLAGTSNVDFRFLIEQRANTDKVLQELGDRHRQWLSSHLPAGACTFHDVEVISEDGATVAGRNAVSIATAWYDTKYSDIVIDGSGMSRGICFPLLRQAMQVGERHGANVHVIVASNNHRTIDLKSESNDRADWIHGFQGKMGLDTMAEALTLWIPQLAHGSVSQLDVMYRHLSALDVALAEICPIVPFPSVDPRRGDELLFSCREALRGDVGNERLNVIYAHEADPMDVFYSIVRMESIRREVFEATRKKAVSVLSPAGWRLGSLGMVLAAIALDLPLLYVETIGYTTESPLPEPTETPSADRKWHIWVTGSPYAVSQSQ
jgi:hypothetical protein